MALNEVRQVIIPRKRVESGDISQALLPFQSLGSDVETALETLGTVHIVFAGYEGDTREVWEIPEVRSWYGSLCVALPHLLLFLCPETGASKLHFALTLEGSDKNGANWAEAGELLTATYPEVNAFCESIGLNPAHDRIQELFTTRLLGSLGVGAERG